MRKKRNKISLLLNPSHRSFCHFTKTTPLFLWFLLEYIVDLQSCISFRCTIKWISQTYTYNLFLLNYFPRYVITYSPYPMDCSLPGFSVHGTFQAILLEWIAISYSRGSSQPRDWTQASGIVDRHFTNRATREVNICHYRVLNRIPCAIQ